MATLLLIVDKCSTWLVTVYYVAQSCIFLHWCL